MSDSERDAIRLLFEVLDQLRLAEGAGKYTTPLDLKRRCALFMVGKFGSDSNAMDALYATMLPDEVK